MSGYFDRIERQLVRRVEAGPPRRSRLPVRLGHLAVAASILVVIAVGAVFVGIRRADPAGSPTGGRAIRIVFSASRLDPRAPLGPSIASSIRVLRRRLDSVFRGVRVSRTGSELAVVVPQAAGVSRRRIVTLTVPARFELYDWEANALTPNGKTVASQPQRQAATAVKVSQGTGSAAPGEPGAGSLPLYQAVVLASKQPPSNTLGSSSSGSQYYLFGAPGSPACGAASRDQGKPAVAGVRCLLAGPGNTLQALASSHPVGVSASHGQRLDVPRGIVVLQAQDVSATKPVPLSPAAAQFYVLKDNAALSGIDLTHPSQSTDQVGAPTVNFGFTSTGANKFQHVTRTIARRGQTAGGLGNLLNQHFAAALDNQLISVPSIDYKTYPDGIPGGQGADLTGGFTIQSARTLATLLRYGPLSVNLVAR